MPALVSSPASDSQPIGRSSRRFCCRLLWTSAERCRRSSISRCSSSWSRGEIGRAVPRGASGSNGGDRHPPFLSQRRLQPVQQLAGARQVAKGLRVAARAQRLEPAPEQVEPGAQRCRVVLRGQGAIERVQQPLELEARLEHAPARFGGAGADDWPSSRCRRRSISEQAGGEHQDGDDQQQAAPSSRARAAYAHATSIAVSCQIERWRWMRSSSSGCWLQG